MDCDVVDALAVTQEGACDESPDTVDDLENAGFSSKEEKRVAGGCVDGPLADVVIFVVFFVFSWFILEDIEGFYFSTGKAGVNSGLAAAGGRKDVLVLGAYVVEGDAIEFISVVFLDTG